MNESLNEQEISLEDLLEAHLDTLTGKITEQLINGNLTATGANRLLVANGVRTELASIASYLGGEAGTSTEMRNRLEATVLEQIRQGATLEQLQAINEVISNNLAQTVAEELSEPAHEQLRQRYLRRLDSLNTLVNVTTISAGIAARQSQTGILTLPQEESSPE